MSLVVMLYNMDEYITFSGNNLLTHVTPNDPKSKFESVSFVKISSLFICISHVTIQCILYEEKHFSKNELLTPVTPNDPKSRFESISFVKGLKLVNIPESRDPAM